MIKKYFLAAISFNPKIMVPHSNLVTGALVTAAATGTLFFLYFVYKGGNKIEDKKSEVCCHKYSYRKLKNFFSHIYKALFFQHDIHSQDQL